jgi:hypothetical protein
MSDSPIEPWRTVTPTKRQHIALRCAPPADAPEIASNHCLDRALAAPRPTGWLGETTAGFGVKYRTVTSSEM